MKITETIERECCYERDLKPVEGCAKVQANYVPEVKFCVHCGARHFYTTFTDEAGGREWEYRKESSVPTMIKIK